LFNDDISSSSSSSSKRDINEHSFSSLLRETNIPQKELQLALASLCMNSARILLVRKAGEKDKFDELLELEENEDDEKENPEDIENSSIEKEGVTASPKFAKPRKISKKEKKEKEMEKYLNGVDWGNLDTNTVFIFNQNIQSEKLKIIVNQYQIFERVLLYIY
jgi:hypothetical protein